MSVYELNGRPRSYWDREEGRNKSTEGYTGEIELTRERVNRQGYTSRGKYYGTGEPIFTFYSDHGTFDGGFRAADRKEAKAMLRRDFPRAKIR